MCVHREKAMCGHIGKLATSKPRREASEKAKPADPLVMNFYPPELWENTFLLFKPPILWYLVMMALAHSSSEIMSVNPINM